MIVRGNEDDPGQLSEGKIFWLSRHKGIPGECSPFEWHLGLWLIFEKEKKTGAINLTGWSIRDPCFPAHRKDEESNLDANGDDSLRGRWREEEIRRSRHYCWGKYDVAFFA